MAKSCSCNAVGTYLKQHILNLSAMKATVSLNDFSKLTLVRCLLRIPNHEISDEMEYALLPYIK